MNTAIFIQLFLYVHVSLLIQSYMYPDVDQQQVAL